MLTTDFLSGCIHWAADTWGSKDWPIVGNHLIGPFREHHVDPKAITQHNFVETNGENCFIAIPFVIGGIVCLNQGAENGSFYLASISLAGLATNQIHKWAHQEERPTLVTFLQNARIILSPRAHGVHHTPPFENDYCITTGWMNPILRHLRFFRILESFITFLTRVPPREEDLSLQKD
jgi:ubiquitin-conjugating enzyme E2 variant